MPDPLSDPRFLTPATVEEALAALARPGAVALAGGTWTMRAPLRHEASAESLVSLSGISRLQVLGIGDDRIDIGPMLSHDGLTALPDDPDLRGLRMAAGAAANPGVRRLATVGGNLCAADFAAADLVPALMALDAQVTVATATGEEEMDVLTFLTRRAAPGPWLLTAIRAGRGPGRLSAHSRLPMRKAGDYPCAIVSISLAVDAQGRIRDPRIAVGAVEYAARRWAALEQAIAGAPLDADGIEAQARTLAAEFTPRDGPDAPGWYRLSVLPVLLRRAIESLTGKAG